VIVAFVASPIGVALQGGAGTLLLSPGPDLVRPEQQRTDDEASIQSELSTRPAVERRAGFPGHVGSREALCYVAIAILGIAGLLRRR
jgi:hypothetical protein